jgi:hypothetical protein
VSGISQRHLSRDVSRLSYVVNFDRRERRAHLGLGATACVSLST